LLEHPPGESSREKNYVGGCGRLIRL
jgi:hypothetical protein